MSLKTTVLVNSDSSLKCAFCALSAIKTVTAKYGDEVSTCGSMYCDLQLLYRYNTGMLPLIGIAEHYLKITPAPILIARVKHIDARINGTTKAGFLLHGGDDGSYLWVEIFSNESIEDLRHKIIAYNQMLEVDRTVIVTEESLHHSRINTTMMSRLEMLVVHT